MKLTLKEIVSDISNAENISFSIVLIEWTIYLLLKWMHFVRIWKNSSVWQWHRFGTRAKFLHQFWTLLLIQNQYPTTVSQLLVCLQFNLMRCAPKWKNKWVCVCACFLKAFCTILFLFFTFFFISDRGKDPISDLEDASDWMDKVQIGIHVVSQYANSRLCSPNGYIGLIRCDRAEVLMYQLQAFLRELPLFFSEDKRLFQLKNENETIWEDLQCRSFYWIKHRGCYFHNCIRRTCSGIW